MSIPVYLHSSLEAAKIEYDLDTINIDPQATDEEQAAAKARIPACILIGRFRSYVTNHYGGADVASYGTPVTAYAAGGKVVYHTFVHAKSRYEPDTRNKIGGMGAWRDIPNEEGIKQAIATAQEHLAE